MIKNTSLGLCLVLLIGFAYFWEERGQKKFYTDNVKEEKIVLFDVNSVVSLTLKNSKLIKNQNEWVIGELGYMANKSKVQFILKTLNGITKVKKIDVTDEKEKEFFIHQDHSFTVKTFNKEVTFRLGDISNVTGMFYIQKFELGKKELFLCRDINVYDGLYKNELEANYQKYIYLKDIVTANPMELISPKLIYGLNSQKLSKLKIDNKANRWFEVDFENNITTPKRYSGIKQLVFSQVFDSLWNMVSVDKIIDEEDLILSDQLSSVDIKLKSSKNHKIILYGLLNGEQGYYAKVDNSKIIYKINEKAKDFFFANVQNFWDKRLNLGVDFKKLKRVEFQIGFDPREFHSFYIDDIDSFDIKSASGKKIKVSNFNLLFNIILNLQTFKQAKYVVESPNKRASKHALYVNIFNKKLKIVFNTNMVIVSDLSEGLEFFYPHNNSMINIKSIDDFFTLN